VLFSKLKTSVTGVDFMMSLCEMACEENKKVFFFGGRNDAAKKTAEFFKKMFPNLKVGGFSEDEKE